MLIKLFAALTRGADIEVLVDILKRVPDFTLRLMALANSPERRRLHKVTTLNQAIIALGMLNIRRLVKIVLFAGTDEKSLSTNPLLQTVILRGRLMEMCGDREVRRDAFLVGMLSLADALFKQPLADVLTAIQAEKSWVAALLKRQGTLGQLLDMAEAAERADDDQLRHTLEQLGMPSVQRFARVQAEALRWASGF
jgi:c-di-GMP-related signal transduction protein